MKRRTAVLLALTLSLVLVGASAQGRAGSIRPQILADGGPSARWQAPQFVQSDGKGRVFLLRGDDLSVYPVESSGRLGEPERLRGGSPRSGSIMRAVMSSTGQWILLQGPGKSLLVLEDRKVTELPPVGWFTDSVALLRGTPVASVYSLWVGSVPKDSRADPPPFLFSHLSGRWSPILYEKVPELTPEKDRFMDSVLSRRALLLGDRQGKLWIAQQYVYRVRRLSAAGKPLLSLTIGKQEPQPVEDVEQVQQRFAKQAGRHEAEGSGRKARATAITAQEVVHAMAEGRDGRLYLLVSAGGPALDRFDPLEGVLERLPLTFPEVERVTSMAAGGTGLYMAAYRGDGGRFSISWDVLEAAEWERVKNARVSAGRD